MSDTITEAAERPSAVYTGGGDERLTYRGIFQRLFIRPEIGALIGVVGLWVFFWAVAIPFGTANGASNIIDFASSPLGIMAVAVSLLMVGGEFDLSTGANTGAMGILVVMLSKEAGEFGGLGLTLWLAIPLSLAVALAIGYLNGFLVERTKLPSFTITLGTYYVLWGAKLGFSKLIVDQVQVGDIRDASGHDFWVKIFASSWTRNDHVWGQRDTVYFVALMLAIALVVLAAFEMHFDRRGAGLKAAGLPVFLAGLGGIVVGIVVLHTTDGVSGNWLGAAVIAAGTIIASIGMGQWRFEPIHHRGAVQFTPEVARNVGIGVGSIVLAILIAWRMDAYNAEDFIFPFTKQGFRATLFMLFGGAGFVFLLIGQAGARRISVATRSAVNGVLAAMIVLLAFFIRWEAKGDPSDPESVGSVKFRSEAFSVMLALALVIVAWTVLSLLFAERRQTDHRVDKLGSRMLIVAAGLVAIGMAAKLLFVVQKELDAGLAPATFSVRTLWFLGFTALAVFVLGKTRFGSWTFAVGGNKEAARQVGVPAARTKTQLFMIVAGAAWLCGMLLSFRLNTIQANTGNGEEFDYIIAAVVGGTLLTGGYGTAMGGALGAMIVAIATLGIPFARWNSDWSKLFLGVILLLAMLANRSIRTKAEAMRK